MATLASSVLAFHVESAMVAAGAERLQPFRNVSFVVADMSEVALANDSTDLVIEGRGGGHLAIVEGARAAADALTAGMPGPSRSARVLMVVDAIGSNTTAALPPNDPIAEFYARLEHHRSSRAAYQCPSTKHAVEHIGCCFGRPMAADMVAIGSSLAP